MEAAAQLWNVEKLRSSFGSLCVPVRSTDDEFKVFFRQGQARPASGQRGHGVRLPRYDPKHERRSAAAVCRQHQHLQQCSTCWKVRAARVGLPNFPEMVPALHERRVSPLAWRRRTAVDDSQRFLSQLQRAADRSQTFRPLFAPDRRMRSSVIRTSFIEECGQAPSTLEVKTSMRIRFRAERATRSELAAGEVLFIPRFWWHFVEALTFSLNVAAGSHFRGWTRSVLASAAGGTPLHVVHVSSRASLTAL